MLLKAGTKNDVVPGVSVTVPGVIKEAPARTL
jgi:hypothetical protein